MISERFRAKILQASVSSEFDPKTDMAVDFYPSGKGGEKFVLMDRSQKTDPSKPLISDYDGVLNRDGSDPPTMIWLQKLFDGNYGLRQNRDRIIRNIGMLERGGDEELLASEIERDFKENDLSSGFHLGACDHAANSFELVKNYAEARDDLTGMGYRLYILTAAPADLVAMSRERLGVEPWDFEASRFVFDESGKFKHMELNLGGNRYSKRDRLLERSAFTRYGLEITVDDNPVTGSRIVKSGWPHAYFWLGTATDMQENVSVGLKDARQDFNKIPDAVEKMEAGYSRIMLYEDGVYKQIVNLANDIHAYSKRLANFSGLNFKEGKLKLYQDFGNYAAAMRGLYDYRRNGTLGDVLEMQNEKDEIAAKILLKKFSEKFYASSLEAKLPTDLVRV